VEHAAVDAFLDDAWWLGVDLGVVDRDGKVRVCFPETREVMEFDAADVRPHLEWVRGSFKQRSARGMVIRPPIFRRATKASFNESFMESFIA